MKEFLNSCITHNAVGSWIIVIISFGLLIGGFFCPPLGVIDNSVLIAVGMMNISGVIFFKLDDIIASIRDGKSITIKHGQSAVTIDSDKEDDK